MSRQNVRCVLCLLGATVVFYWQILLTHQFTLLSAGEGVHQAYSWLHFWLAAIKSGVAPLWDPYTFGGHSFLGEMDTQAFYPLNLILALFPFNNQGAFSPQLYHQWFAFAHFLGACFMFALARELGLSRFASIMAGICFAFGGFMARMEWMDLIQSSIWLPLIFLFLLRAFRAADWRRSAGYAAIAGLFLGMSILGGRIHIVIMQAIIAGAAAGFAIFTPEVRAKAEGRRGWLPPVIAGAIVIAIGICAGAVQLLPSLEFSGHVLRFLGNGPPQVGSERIPYAYVSDGHWPHSLAWLLFSLPFGGNLGPGEAVNPNASTFALIAALIGIWRRWSNNWVRFLTGLAVGAFLFTLGSFSVLHGFMYATVPGLWMIRQPARFIYLISFALPILAGFGIDALLRSSGPGEWQKATRAFSWVAIATAVGLAAPMLFGRPDMNPWMSLSCLILFAAYGVYRYVIQGRSVRAAQFLIIALVLFDLGSFNWGPRDKTRLAAANQINHLDRLMSCRGAAQFLKTRPGPFRVRVHADPEPSIGDVYGLRTVVGMSATVMKDMIRVRGNDALMNIRYILRPASVSDPSPVYSDAFWKVYATDVGIGQAWVVHKTVVEGNEDRLFERVNAWDSGIREQAYVGTPLPTSLEPKIEGTAENVTYLHDSLNRAEISVNAASRGLLVVSEADYPGWSATVNGRPATIYKVNGALRGIGVPAGHSRVVMRYAPWTVYAGGAVSLLTFAGVAGAWLFAFWRKRRSENRETTASAAFAD